MKRFKTKKKFNSFIIYLGIFLISVAISVKYLYKNNKINNNTIVDLLINDNLGTYKHKITDVDFILKYALNVDLKKDDLIKKNEPVIKEDTTLVEEQKDTEVVKSEPIVYLYNTHQEEKYLSNYMNGYNISTGVFEASKILKEYLNSYGINAIVEEDSVTQKLHNLNWKYGSSYKVSRMFLESACENNPSLKYFIDIHRDSSKYDATTTEIDGEKYARILFVIGLDHDNYEPNLELAEKLKKRIIEYNEQLFRGIMKKSGKGVNGIYNQDFNSNTILIEVGGQYNSIEEVNNTLKVLAKIFSEYIRDDLNG